MIQEVQMNGFIYQIIWIHSGQYHRYGDTFKIARIETQDPDPNSILEIMKIFFKYDVPLKENWNNRSIDEYFRGYCIIEKTKDGFIYTKVEPYTD